jgi:catechol 2,3-dioxygenase-like lactoylglutathione lyase family enzyme
MFSHVMLGTNDIERSKRFYDAPNPSFKRTANGASPWPRGRVVYHRPRGQGATPLAAA